MAETEPLVMVPRSVLEQLRDFISSEYTDARASALEGHPIAAEARGVWTLICEALAAAALPPAAAPGLGEDDVEWMALVLQDADNRADPDAELAASGLNEDVSDWGAYLARALIAEARRRHSVSGKE